MAICPDVVPSIIDFITPGQKSIFVEATGAQIPVANSLHDVHSDLASISNACIVVQEQVMLVWSNDSRTLVNVAHDIETQLLALVSEYPHLSSTPLILCRAPDRSPELPSSTLRVNLQLSGIWVATKTPSCLFGVVLTRRTTFTREPSPLKRRSMIKMIQMQTSRAMLQYDRLYACMPSRSALHSR